MKNLKFILELDYIDFLYTILYNYKFIYLAVESFCIPRLLLGKSSGHTEEFQPEQ